MAAPQVAGARAVLGLGVRAAQAPEVKHQAAKQFFKEVRRPPGQSWDADRRLPSLRPPRWEPPPGPPPAAAASHCCLPATTSTSIPRPQVCRCLPWAVDNYRLDELTTVPELRRNLAAMFRKYTDVQVIGCGTGF